MSTNDSHACDQREIVRALNIILEPGQVTELRALDASFGNDRWKETISGYFDDPRKLAAAAASISAKGVYFIPNVPNPALLARACNRIRAVKKEPTTSDGDMVGRRWLLVDADVVRPAGISSSASEHEAAIKRAEHVAAMLALDGWPSPVYGDSGNGGHLLYRIELPADDDGLCERCLQSLDRQYSTDSVKIDTTTANPARIWRLYGAVNGKGDSVPDRPHRMAKILSVPDAIEVVPHELLRRLAESAAETPKAPTPNNRKLNGKSPSHSNGKFELATWIAQRGLDVDGPEDWTAKHGHAKRWVFSVCPWDSSHTNRSAWVAQFDSGELAAGCHHNGCAGNDWHALRDKFEPGWRQPNASIGTAWQHSKQRPANEQKSEEPWPDPLPLPSGLPPVMPFEPRLMPAGFRPWMTDIADRMQCPPDYIATTAVIAVATLIGRKIGIRPKRHDDWQVVPNLWGFNVGRPSVLKSPAMKEALTSLTRLEIDAKQDYADALREYEAGKLLADAQKKAKADQLKKAVKDGGNAKDIANELAGLGDDKTPPVRKRYMTSNTTVEKLGELLRDNPDGVLIYSDELIGFLKSIDREGHEADRGFYLTAWDGDKRYTYDRIGRGTIDIEAACVSIVGSIQPGVLHDYLRGAVAGGSGDDGLIQRFQLSVWPDPMPTWRNVDRYPNTTAKQCAYKVFQQLAALNPADICAQNDDGKAEVPYLRFGDVAQAMFDDWRDGLERRLRANESHPAFEAHLAKYRSLIPSLSLIFHLVDSGVGPVTADALERALLWADYLESHALRLFASVIDGPAVSARELGRRIMKGEVTSPFAARDVYRKGWTGLDKESTAGAIDVLASLRWLEERTTSTAGRDKVSYVLNPKLRIPPAEELTELPQAPSVSFVSTVPEANHEIKEPVEPLVEIGQGRDEL